MLADRGARDDGPAPASVWAGSAYSGEVRVMSDQQQGGPTAAPQYSPDGQWWWNGREWVPAQQGPSQQEGPSQQQTSSQPPIPQTPPPERRRRWPWVAGGLVALVVLLSVCVAAVSSGSSTKSTGGVNATPTPATKASAAAAAQTTAPTTAPKPQYVTFHDGTLRVGQDVQPGTYRTRSGSPGCYFARLKGFSGQLEDIAANGNTNGPAVVTITAADKGFQSRGCATWTSDLSAITNSPTSFGDGDFIVGTDIQPGSYRSNGPGGCYYARLSGFSHELPDIIANDNAQGPAVVTVAPGDKGFESSGCGTWTRS
jgi:hypothetical protein